MDDAQKDGASADSVNRATHPILHSAYPSEVAPPRHWPSPPTHKQFTIIDESDSAVIEELNRSAPRSRDKSLLSSPAMQAGPRGPGHTPNLSREADERRGACAAPAGSWGGGEDDDLRAPRYSDSSGPSSSDDETDRGSFRTRSDGTPKWSTSSGAHDGSFKKRSPDVKPRSPSASSVLAAAELPRGGRGEVGAARAPAPRFAAISSSQRHATLAALSDLQGRARGSKPAAASGMASGQHHADDSIPELSVTVSRI